MLHDCSLMNDWSNLAEISCNGEYLDDDEIQDRINIEKNEVKSQLQEAREAIKETVEHLEWRDEIQDGLGTLKPFYEKLKSQLKNK